MLDVPGFVLAAVRDLFPEHACIIRLDKRRFRIEHGCSPTRSMPTRQSVVLVLNEPLVTAIQWAIVAGDQQSLLTYTGNINQQLARHLAGLSMDAEVSIHLV
jgi:hypothetical protein